MSAAGWAWAALAIYVVGLIMAFGVRTWLQLRQTGSSGFRGISGRPTSLAWWAGVLFPAAALLMLCAPVLVLTGASSVWPSLVHPVIATAGLTLAVAGLVVVLIAQTAMGSSWRIGVDESERTQLVTDGPFRLVRNPIFTGMAMVTLGVTLMVPTFIAAVAVITLVASVEIQVRLVEEPYLLRVHGDTYARYAATTGRFLPMLGRIRSTGAR